MKKAVLLLIILPIFFNSCRKEMVEKELIGTWQEIQPCVRDSSGCYVLQFTSNNMVFEAPPFADTGSYTVLTYKTIRIDSSIVWPGWQLSGSLVFSFTINNNEMTIKNFYTPLLQLGLTPNPTYDIHLQKK